MKYRGVTLVECLVVVSIIGILTIFTYPLYQRHTRDSQLRGAFNAMLDNQHALEQYYARYGRFKKNSTTWADLPIQQTEYFCIKFQGNPRGVKHAHQYTIKAVALDKNREKRVLLINQDHVALICESSSSHCSEKDFFANQARSNLNCKTYM